MIGPEAPESNVRSKSMNAAPRAGDEVFTLADYSPQPAATREMGKAPHCCGASQPRILVAGGATWGFCRVKPGGGPTAIWNKYALPTGKRARRTPR